MKQLLLFLWLCPLALLAQPLPEGGKSILNYKRLRNLQVEKDGGSIQSNQAEKNHELTFTINTVEQPDHVYNLAVRLPTWSRDIKRGEVLLLSFEGKTNFASLETDEARVKFMFGTTKHPHDRPRKTVSISNEWRRYFVPVEVMENLSKEDFFVAMQFGYPPQEFEMRRLHLEVFPVGTRLSDMPKTRVTYIGQEADAPWRAAARERIMEHRCGDFTINFSQRGTPLAEVPIHVELVRPHFGWGAAIRACDFDGPEDSATIERYAELFNLAVFENDTKIKAWQRHPDRREEVLGAYEHLSKYGVDLKGHVLLWGGFRHLTPIFQKHRDDPAKLQQLVDEHLEDILGALRGKISRWDVINEANTNTDLVDLTGGEDIYYRTLRRTAELDPDARRFVNEFGIINRGGLNEKKQRWYHDYVQRLDRETGGLIGGIGIQSHIGTDLTPIPKVLQLLDYYAELGKDISISEFTMDVQDPEVRYAYTRDFLTAAYSNPAVSEFLFWGYRREKADILQPDDPTELGAMGRAFHELVHQQWRLDREFRTDDRGRISERAVFGTYAYSYVLNGRTITRTFEILPGRAAVVNIDLP